MHIYLARTLGMHVYSCYTGCRRLCIGVALVVGAGSHVRRCYDKLTGGCACCVGMCVGGHGCCV